MKSIRIELVQRFWLQVVASCIILMHVFASASANEKDEVAVSENQVTISEFDFKQMVLYGHADTVSNKLNLGEHLWKAPSWNHGDEFVIMKIPFSKGFKGVKPDKGANVVQRE